MAWTDEKKKQVVDAYMEQNPTPETSVEICKQIATDMNESPNAIRMLLVQEKVYVKKAEGTSTKGKTTTPKKEGDKPARVSKEDQIAALRAAIENAGKEVDDDILSKLTGKAATYFLSVITG